MTRNITDNAVKKLHDKALRAAEKQNYRHAGEIIAPLTAAQKENKNAATALLSLIRQGCLEKDQAVRILSLVYQDHRMDEEILILAGLSAEAVCDIDDLNAPPPDNPLFSRLIKDLSEKALAAAGCENEAEIYEALATVARLNGRQSDAAAEKAYARLVALRPEEDRLHYNQGLFYKTRGRFTEGLRANQKAIALSDTPQESYLWNAGICATGCGDSETALRIWKELGQKIEPGRFNLPEGRYPSCKIRLARRVLAERTAKNDDPGEEETVWIERLSPCHGIIRSVLYYDLDVNYGDVVLFDGAPITYHKYGDEQIPVFPHLVTLRKSGYLFYDFAGTQNQGGRLDGISRALEKDAIIYSHSENFRLLCATCWRDENLDHAHNKTEEKNVVTGRIAVPPDMPPAELLAQIDAQLKDKAENRLFSPELCRAAGLEDRARIETRRFRLLCDSE